MKKAGAPQITAGLAARADEPVKIGNQHPQRARSTMAATRKSSKPVRTDIVLTDPKKLQECIEVQVGGTVIWECGKPTYPEFHLTFEDANPFNSRQNAKFKGSKDEPLTLVFKKEGTFRFYVTHIKKDGSTIQRGAFCITICPPPIYICKPPTGCPPFC